MADDDDNEDESGGARSFWSGTIAFGLVSLPVNLYTANRRSAVSLRMLDQDGTPLSRRYFCTREDIPLSADDLVRGYEIERDKFVEILDEELEALVPKKSREIDLRRFVPLETIDPMYFERAYFLVPEEGAVKAYRLLAQSMESMGRAGIATVIMRGKEYLIAIIADRGILRAETLRFYDELRTPADVGLPSLKKTSAADMQAIEKEIDKLAADDLDRSELTDEPSRRLLELVQHKIESGEDVMHAPEVPEPESAEIIDLMQVLKKSLEAKASTEAESPGQKKTKAKAASGNGNGKHKRKGNGNGKRKVDPDMTKSELYARAKELDIPGRSHMSREELARVIQEAR